MLEHSILAVSKLYKNISFMELGTLLHTTPGKVWYTLGPMPMAPHVAPSL